MPNPSLKDFGVTLSLHLGNTDALYMQAAQRVYCMHWCVEGCSFQPFLKLCFLVKWLIFFPKGGI